MSTILMTSKLTKRFGKFTAVKDLDLEVREGEIFGFLGPNGAGKSTTIRMLLDLIRPSSGEVKIFDRSIRKHGAAIRRHIGYQPGELALYENLSPAQLFRYSASLYGVDSEEYARYLSERLGIADMHASIGSLSQGNKQKVGVVQALAHRPKLAILDEPTNALDPLIRHELQGILLEAKEQGMTVFFSSHVLAEAEQICDRVAIIRDGRLTRVGTIEEMKAIAPKRMRIAFADHVPATVFEDLQGVTSAVANGRGEVELLVRSGLDEVVRIASQHQVRDFYSEAMSLEDIFLGYYETSATQTTNGHGNGAGGGHGALSERRPDV